MHKVKARACVGIRNGPSEEGAIVTAMHFNPRTYVAPVTTQNRHTLTERCSRPNAEARRRNTTAHLP